MATIGGASLLPPCVGPASIAAVALSAIAMRANTEHGFASVAASRSKQDFWHADDNKPPLRSGDDADGSLLNRRVIKKRHFLMRGDTKDPGYALAYSGVADAYSVLPNIGDSPSENFPKSNAAARKALELDATLARPHAVLGSNEMEYDWDFAGGEAEYKKAFQLDPNDATGHWQYAYNIALIGGREQEALAEVNRAHQLDPLSPLISMMIGYVHIFPRQYDEAI